MEIRLTGEASVSEVAEAIASLPAYEISNLFMEVSRHLTPNAVKKIAERLLCNYDIRKEA